VGVFRAGLGARAPRGASMTASSAGLPTALALLLLVLSGCNGEDQKRAESLTGGDVDRGKLAILRRGCGSCHTIPRIPGADARVGPSLEHLASRSILAGTLPNHPQQLMEWIQHPQHFRSPTAMPDLALGEQEVRDIAAFLYTLE
jgi:cytochrome c2